MAGSGQAMPMNNSEGIALRDTRSFLGHSYTSITRPAHSCEQFHPGFCFAGQTPGNVTNTGVGDNPPKGSGDKQEQTADTKVNVDDAVVAKAPDGGEVDFKKISIEEALKVLKVCAPPQ